MLFRSDAHESEQPVDWHWALTQGGLTIAILTMGWSYRKDLIAKADERVRHERAIAAMEMAHEKALNEEKQKVNEERIAFQQAKVDEAVRSNRALERLLDLTNTTLRASADAMTQHAVVLAENTGSIHRLARAVDGRG